MARVEFTQEQEKALIKYLSKRYIGKQCLNCKHESGSCYPLSKICEKCGGNHSKWKPNKYCMPYIMKELEEIKKNK